MLVLPDFLVLLAMTTPCVTPGSAASQSGPELMPFPNCTCSRQLVAAAAAGDDVPWKTL